MISNRKQLRMALNLGVAFGAMVAWGSPALAEEDSGAGFSAVSVQASSAGQGDVRDIEERQAYALRLLLQIYDGQRDFSHTQLLGIGRIRKGEQSFSQFDFGDGAVLIEGSGGKLAASRFMNISPTEKGVLYDYRTKTVSGDNEIAQFHNAVIRPLLGQSPDLGQDAEWSTRLPLAALGLVGAGDLMAAVTLSREYFVHDGKPMVLIHYAIPAFAYDDTSGRQIVQWGSGLSLSDPGFGKIYFNTALHRAVARDNGSAGVPYRYSRTMVAANPDGSASIDYRTVPQLAKYIDEFFSKQALQVVPTGETSTERSPIQLARNLDLVSLSIAEDGANEAPVAAGAQVSLNRGAEASSTETLQLLQLEQEQNQSQQMSKPTTALDVAEGTGDFLNTVLGYTDKGVAITGGLLATRTTRLAEISKNLGQNLNAAANNYSQASERLKQEGKLAITLLPEAELRFNNIIKMNNEANEIERQIDALSTGLARVVDAGGTVMQADLDEASRLVSEYNRLHDASAAEMATFEAMKDKYALKIDMSDPHTAQLVKNVENAAEDLNKLEDVAKIVKNEASLLQEIVKVLPTEKIGAALKYFGDSPAGKILDGVSHGMNAYTVGTAINNTIDAAYNDKSSGQISTARDYSLSSTVLDLAALAGNAVSGNVPGFLSDATAIVFGSVGDVFLTGKALKDTHQLNAQLLQQTREMDARLSQMRHDKVMSLESELQQAGLDLSELEAEIDSSVAMSEELLEERRKAREEIRRQEEEARLRQEQRDRQAEQDRIAREEENERRRTANDRLEEDMSPDYPTAPPHDPGSEETTPVASEDESPSPVLTIEEQAAIEREERREKAQAELDEYQAKKLAEMKAEEAEREKNPGTHEFRVSQLETSELVTTAFDIDPVTFDGPEWEPPVWEPPVWVPPEFTPPDVSTFPPTDPDDLDGYPGTGQYPAYTYESMSGQEPDLAKWEDWLATQDRRKLEQLAIASGYPSLAFALADAENIIRKSLDQGYRAYANRGPNCAGYTGCTGSIGPWKLAYATIRLGDILAKSREIFSTGGFSDIGISGFNLMYMLRDFGVQDGDLIDIEISQFGQPIFSLKGHFLLTAGSAFNVNLRPGVAQMVITALNEGSASPNTAEVSIDNVVRGEATQNYSLNTGQTAVLRIEANASQNSQ